MITVCEENYNQIYYGLSSDHKPQNKVENGSLFVELDTGKYYLYDLEHHIWLLQSK